MDDWSQISVRGPGQPVRHASVAWRAAHEHLGSERARFQPILAIFSQQFLSGTKVWRSILKKLRLRPELGRNVPANPLGSAVVGVFCGEEQRGAKKPAGSRAHKPFSHLWRRI